MDGVSGYCKSFLMDECRLNDEEFTGYVIEEFIDLDLDDKIDIIKQLENTDFAEQIDRKLKFLIRGMLRDNQIELCEKHLVCPHMQ